MLMEVIAKIKEGYRFFGPLCISMYFTRLYQVIIIFFTYQNFSNKKLQSIYLPANSIDEINTREVWMITYKLPRCVNESF